MDKLHLNYVFKKVKEQIKKNEGAMKTASFVAHEMYHKVIDKSCAKLEVDEKKVVYNAVLDDALECINYRRRFILR